MKIGILGSGIVGKTLAGGFLKHGYEVMAGSRQPEKLQDWKAEIGPKLQTGNYSETAAFADIIVLAVKGTVARDVLKLAGIDNLSGKTVLDATNPIADAAPVNGVLQFFSSLDESLMEQLQNLAPKANFVKAFNSVGAHVMVNPKFETRPTMFICGNNEAAKEITKKILDQFGWEVEDMGGTEAARAIEPLCILWCIPGFRENRWTHAFKLLNK
ncbi:MAG: NAD(P)-binding domain-containing protein [Calditrichaeota bacterium]|nr:NAD(P)-binding domain-containing protein [Calditrichota bacterium]